MNYLLFIVINYLCYLMYLVYKFLLGKKENFYAKMYREFSFLFERNLKFSQICVMLCNFIRLLIFAKLRNFCKILNFLVFKEKFAKFVIKNFKINSL